MSTRASIIIKNGKNTEYVYRHSDGYPECTGDDLKNICTKADFDRDAIIDGMSKSISEYTKRSYYEYEGTDSEIHADVDWVYVINIKDKTLTAYEVCPFNFKPLLNSIVRKHEQKVEIISNKK